MKHIVRFWKGMFAGRPIVSLAVAFQGRRTEITSKSIRMSRLSHLVSLLLVFCVSTSAQTLRGKKLYMDDDDQRLVGEAKSAVPAAAPKPVANSRFSAVGDFSTTLNPNGAWSYGFTTTLGGAFIPYTLSGTTFSSGEVGWFGPIGGYPWAPGYPLVTANPVVSARQLLDTGPGPGGEYTVIRWTAPSKGTWDVVGRFQGLGSTSTDVHVLHNGSSLFDFNLFNSDSAPFSITLQANAGDTIDLAIGYGPDLNFGGDPTGLEAVITPHLFDFVTIAFPGAAQTRPLGLNDKGDVVGWYLDAAGSTHGFALDENGFRSIDFPDAVRTVAAGINNKGEIVGLFDEKSTLPSGFEHGFVLNNGKFEHVDFPGASDTDILGINNRGDFSGAYDLGDITTAIGFLNDDGKFVSFEVPGSFPMATIASGINDRGQVVGTYGDIVDPSVTHSFLRDGNNFVTLDYPNADSTLLTGINNRANMVGNCFCIDGLSHGILYSRGNFTIVDFPVDSSRTRLRAINNRGQLVGFYRPGGTGPFLGFIATPAEKPEAFTTIDFPGAINTQAAAITPDGEIAGRYISPDGRQHGFTFDDDVFKSIDVPGANYTDTAWINAAGDVAGSYSDPSGNHAYALSHEGTLTTIDFASPPPTCTAGFGISNGGDVVGVGFTCTDFFHGQGYLF